MMKSLFMKIAGVLFCFVAAVALAGDFKSEVLGPTESKSIQVEQDRLLVIRNFTQNGGTERGVVTVHTTAGVARVLTAAILDITTTTSTEVINQVTIAGPAVVTVQCGSDATDCFITYRKSLE